MRSDPHASRIAWRIEHQLAPAIALARDAIDARLGQLDGWGSGSDEPQVTTSTSTSSTERHATRRAQLAADHEQIHDDTRALGIMVDDLLRYCRRLVSGIDLIEADLPAVPLCMEGLAGKEGSIEWGDVTCAMPAVKRDLCQQHYDAWRKHRMSRGIDTSRDHQPAA